MKRVTLSLLLLLIVACNMSQAQSQRDLPVVVARLKLTGQTQTIPMTKIFTPKSTGMFRASVVLAETVAQGNDRWTGALMWTDVAADEQSEFFSVQTNFVHTELSSHLMTPFLAKAGTPLKFFVNSEGGTNAGTYDLFIVIERLTKIPTF